MDVSIAMVDVTTKLAPAVLADTVRVPTLVTLEAVSCKKIMLLAVTTLVEIVAVPPTSVPVPADPLVPVVTVIFLARAITRLVTFAGPVSVKVAADNVPVNVGEMLNTRLPVPIAPVLVTPSIV